MDNLEKVVSASLKAGALAIVFFFFDIVAFTSR